MTRRRLTGSRQPGRHATERDARGAQRRRSSPALRRGSYRAVTGSPKDVFAYVREAAGERWLVALNFGEEPVEFDASEAPGWLRLSTNPDRPVDRGVEAPLVLGADEGVLIECWAANS